MAIASILGGKMLKEFRDFVTKGNVLDLAIGIIIGAAFTAIVGSFVKDILTPVIGLVGKANFENMFLVLREGDTPGPYPTPDVATRTGAVVMTYGVFLNALISFLLVALVLFLIVRSVNKLRARQAQVPADPPAPTTEEKLLTEIRDAIKSSR